jgi:hypothetical protein
VEGVDERMTVPYRGLGGAVANRRRG